MENKTNQKEISVPYMAQVIDASQIKEKLVVCDVCGHANPEFTSLCLMCSNYLTEVKK